MTADAAAAQVVAVANRLPVQRSADGWELSPGGLVTALRPVMTAHSGAWVGWDGGSEGVPSALPDLRVDLRPISLTATQVRHYYHGFSNASLWPLLHDAIEKPRFERAWWHSYRQVNGLFAEAAVRALAARPGALAWVHDYHLMLVPQLIRQQRAGQPVGFFLHVPWPPPDIFARLPWREEILLGLLGADVVSFHAGRYRRNFLQACGRLLGSHGVEVRGSQLAMPDGRTVATITAPISIDAAEFRRHANHQATKRDIQAIGGVNEKIEGFFDLCSGRGLSGEQGVLIPATNVRHLMLDRRVVEAAEAGKFHIYPVRTIDAGIEILTGMTAGVRGPDGAFPDGSFNRLVEARLIDLAEKRRAFGRPLSGGKADTQ